MKNNKAKATAKVDALLAEPFVNDDERMQRIVQQAQAEFMHQAEAKPQKLQKKRLWRGVPVLCTLLIALVVVPFLSAIFNPVTPGNANQFLRKAVVWINNTFSMNIELPVLEEEGTQDKNLNIKEFASVEEAVEYAGCNILVLGDTDDLKVDSVEVLCDSGITLIAVEYLYRDQKISLTMETILDRALESSFENSKEIACQAGVLWMWSNGEMHRAVGYIGEWSVNVRASAEITEVQSLFESIRWFN